MTIPRHPVLTAAWIPTTEGEGDVAKKPVAGKKIVAGVDDGTVLAPASDSESRPQPMRALLVDLLRSGADAGDVRLQSLAEVIPGIDPTQRLKSGHPDVRELLAKWELQA